MARRTRSLLAGLIGCPAVAAVASHEPEQSDPPSGPVQAIHQLAGLLVHLRSDSFSDLT